MAGNNNPGGTSGQQAGTGNLGGSTTGAAGGQNPSAGGQSGQNISGQGGQGGQNVSGQSGQGGHSIGGAGPTQFSGMQIPGVNFPATPQQILQKISTLPQTQREQWQSVLSALPPNQTFATLHDLQQACQSQYQKMNA